MTLENRVADPAQTPAGSNEPAQTNRGALQGGPCPLLSGMLVTVGNVDPERAATYRGAIKRRSPSPRGAVTSGQATVDPYISPN